MAKLTKYEVAKISYTKSDGSSSDREIIPTYVPGNVSAIDVSDMDDESRELLQTRLHEYEEFKVGVMEHLMSFGSWMEATHKKEPLKSLKWRSFIPDKITHQ